MSFKLSYYNNNLQMDPPDPSFNVHSNRGSSTTIHFQGYRYTKAWASSRKIVYRCSSYRKFNCKGRLEYKQSIMEFTITKRHTCKNNDTPIYSEVIDLTSQMKAAIDTIAIANSELTANDIWGQINSEYYTNNQERPITGLTREQVISRVYRIRREHYGGNIYSQIENPPMSLVKGTTLNFFQFHLSTSVSWKNTPERLIGWAHPHLIHLLKYSNTTIFIDGTFRCVPRGFSQCVVFMVLDAASGLYVPTVFTLCTSKTADMYWDVINCILNATEHKLKPAQVVSDFEQGLISSIKTQFPDTDVIGCLFHFKQANYRKMKKLGIPTQQKMIAMRKGIFDMLTVIEPRLVNPEGIHWVQLTIITECAKNGITYAAVKWCKFWSYFVRNWITLYGVETWNVWGMSKHIVARTNNPLERFNREMNSAIPPHPSLHRFVSAIDKLSRKHVQHLFDVREQRARPRSREKAVLPTPIDLTDQLEAIQHSLNMSGVEWNSNTSGASMEDESTLPTASDSSVTSISIGESDDNSVDHSYNYQPSENGSSISN